MALQTFTAGQVLTAAQVTALQANDYNQTVNTKTANYVLVAADKGTRVVMNSASATTITINTSLFTAGDSLRIQNIGAGATVVTAGTATVTSAGSLSIPQWGGGQLYFTSASASIYFPDAITTASPGLTFITSVALSGSSVTSGVVFSSTYDSYLLVCNNLIMGTTDTVLFAQLDASGTPGATGYYSTEYRTQTLDGASPQTSVAYINASEMRLARWLSRRASFQATIFNPNLAVTKSFMSTTTTGTVTGGERPYSNIAGIMDSSTQYNQIKFLASSGTITSGTVRIYGIANS